MTTIEPAVPTRDADRLRASIVEQLGVYWALLPTLSAAKPKSVAEAKAFLADDYVVRFGDMALEAEGTEMLEGIAAENDGKWVTHVEPYYAMVDVEAGRAAAHFDETLSDPRSGSVLREMSYFTHIEFSIEDGRLKLRREHLVEVPARFKVDERPGEPGTPDE